MIKLSNAPRGRYTIKWIFTEPEVSRALQAISIETGKDVTVLGRNPLGGILLRSEAGAFFVDSELLAGITM